jgi:hypothetical protein
MPREIVRIETTLPHYEAVAIFLSALSYPNDLVAREKFFLALCRRWVWLMSLSDDEPQKRMVIRPKIFEPSDQDSMRTLMAGLRRLLQRQSIGLHLILPKAFGATRVSGYSPTVNNLIELVVCHLGWKNKEAASGSTAKTKVWKPSWPVAHAAGAFAWFSYEQVESLPQGMKEYIENDVCLLMLAPPPVFKKLMWLTESFREWLVQEKIYKNVREENTIQFVFVDGTQIIPFGEKPFPRDNGNFF